LVSWACGAAADCALRTAVAFVPSLHLFSLPSRLAAPAGVAAAAVAVAASAAEATFRFWPRFVHRQRTSTELILVEFARRLLRLVVGRHLDEGEAASAPRGGVAHHTDRFDFPCLAEKLLEFRFTRAVGKVADVESASHYRAPRARYQIVVTPGLGSVESGDGHSRRGDHQGRVVYQRSRNTRKP